MDNLKFDEYSVNRIYELMVLKGKCLHYHNEHLEIFPNEHSFYNEMKCATFYTAMSDIVDIYIINFLNEEVSASHEERYPLRKIIDHVTSKAASSSDEYFLKTCNEDLSDLFSNRIDFYIGSSFLDFSVSVYSAFEFWICKMYSELRVRKERKNTRIKRIESIISQHIGRDIDGELLKKISTEIFSQFIYISGSEKMDFVLSFVDKKYSRDICRDKNIVKLSRIKRNTVHNLGLNTGNYFEFKDEDLGNIFVNEEEPLFSDDYRSDIKIYGELVEIYKSVTQNIKLESSDSIYHCKR